MAGGGKGKSTGGKAGPKAPEGKAQKSHSAKAGLQVSLPSSRFEDGDAQQASTLPTKRVVQELKAATSIVNNRVRGPLPARSCPRGPIRR